jgi:CheY-like chemotaxis protein
MLPIPCRIILADHAGRLPQWDALAAALPAPALTPIDPRPFALWDVSALAITYQVGPERCSLLDILPALARLHWYMARLCYAREQGHFLVFLERCPGTTDDLPGMQREIEAVAQAAPAITCDPFPYNGACRNGVVPHHGLPRWEPSVTLPPGMRTLVLVEDEMVIRNLVQRFLHEHFLIIECAGSLDALNLAERLPFPLHVLISDIGLPHLDGPTLAQRWLLRRPESAVLLLSGDEYEPTDPAVSFLQKPFSMDEFKGRVVQLAAPAPTPLPMGQRSGA